MKSSSCVRGIVLSNVIGKSAECGQTGTFVQKRAGHKAPGHIVPEQLAIQRWGVGTRSAAVNLPLGNMALQRKLIQL